MTEILKLLEQDGRYTAAQIAAMTGKSEAEVAAAIKFCEDNHVINGYTALVDWEQTENETVTAMIEVKVTPQRDDGFDRIARRIYQYDGTGSPVPVSDGTDKLTVTVAAPILSEGDVLGLVLFVGDGAGQTSGDAEFKLAQTFAAFLGRHMEG